MQLWLIISSGFILGFLGSSHCVGMCGGLISAMSLALPADVKHTWQRWLYLGLFSAGRLLSYSLAAIVVASAGHLLTLGAGGLYARVIAGVLLIMMGLYLSHIWLGLKAIEKIGQGLWRYIQPFMQRFIPVKSKTQALIVGFCWGWVPCGLVYSSLATAVTMGSVGEAALFMLAFGVGTLPAVLLVGVLAERVGKIARNPAFRLTSGILIVLFGIWTLYAALQHAGHAGHDMQYMESDAHTTDPHSLHHHSM